MGNWNEESVGEFLRRAEGFGRVAFPRAALPFLLAPHKHYMIPTIMELSIDDLTLVIVDEEPKPAPAKRNGASTPEERFALLYRDMLMEGA